MSLISPNFAVNLSQSFFLNFGQGPFPKLLEKVLYWKGFDSSHHSKQLPSAPLVWLSFKVTYTQKKKFSQYLCFLIKSTILDLSLSNFIHGLYYRSFTGTCLLCNK